ncbi:MAG: hypothetical protein LBD16_09575 [Oscillospiraceae bacterium]|jgi:hypothetical protein|nr:hypothetical protein [Oscillospiraceae bacterium]
MKRPRNNKKPLESTDAPLYDIENIALFTEMTGIMPAIVDSGIDADEMARKKQ